MNQPQDDRARVPLDRPAPRRRTYAREPSPATDDRYSARRPSGHFGGEGSEPRSDYGFPETRADSVPRAGYYSAATTSGPFRVQAAEPAPPRLNLAAAVSPNRGRIRTRSSAAAVP